MSFRRSVKKINKIGIADFAMLNTFPLIFNLFRSIPIAVRFDEFADFEKETGITQESRYDIRRSERTINFRNFEVAFERRKNLIGRCARRAFLYSRGKKLPRNTLLHQK